VKHVGIVMAGHLATCPRMVKVADALAEAGYRVTVVSTTGWAQWARVADEQMYERRAGKWRWVKVDWDRHSAWVTWLWSALRTRAARRLAAILNPRYMSLQSLGAAHIRISPELARAAARVDADFFYGGGSALAATAIAADRRGVKFALDLEDFHSAEVDPSIDSGFSGRIVERIERIVLPRASFITAASPQISQAYHQAYNVTPTTINNVFPLPSEPPKRLRAEGPFRAYWFSQTIGPNRGLGDAIKAFGLLGCDAELHLRGNCDNGYVVKLRQIASNTAPRLKVETHPPADPDEMVKLAQPYDIGLALERSTVRNRDICLTNKAFTYLPAGLAVAFSDTTAQRELAGQLGDAAIIYSSGHPDIFAEQLRRWASDRDELLRAQGAAWEAAKSRWHWEHELERGALLKLIAAI
jgi:glycosyltransferase involved in cell wall biosynthesis